MTGDEAIELLTSKVRKAIQEGEASIVKAFSEEAESLKERGCHMRSQRYRVAAEVLRDAL